MYNLTMNPITRNVVRFLIYFYSIIYSNFVYLATDVRWLPGLHIPESSMVYWRCKYLSPEKIVFGNNTIICQDVWLDGRAGIEIGNNVVIGTECRIYTLKHNVDSYTEVTGGPVIIKDWAWVANQVTILAGVTIGEGAVVASGAVVTHDVEPWTLVAGVPARFVKNRKMIKYTLNTERIERLP